MKKSTTQYLREILTIPMWQGSAREARAAVWKKVAHAKHPIHLVTLNAEMALFASKNAQAAEAILGADAVLVDSAAIELATRFLAHRPARRIAGIDFAELLLEPRADRAEPVRIALVGCRADDIRDRAAQFVEAHGARVVYASMGPQTLDFDHSATAPWAAELSTARPDVIFLAFHYGYQEWWGSLLAKSVSVPCVIMGVGGTFDVWSGAVARAPLWMRRARIEWLWRVIQEPRRLGRILRATVLFPLRAAAAFLL